MRKATITFPDGDYGQALEHYHSAKAMLLSGGLCFRDDVSGLIKSPEFRGRKSPGGIVPPEWIGQLQGWRAGIEIACLSPAAEQLVCGLALPSGAEIKWEELA